MSATEEEGPPIERWEREGAVGAVVAGSWDRVARDPGGPLTGDQQRIARDVLRRLREAAARRTPGQEPPLVVWERLGALDALLRARAGAPPGPSPRLTDAQRDLVREVLAELREDEDAGPG